MALNIDRFRLGDWLVDPSLSRVTNGDKVVHLEPRAMEVLVFLACRPGELVRKQDLIDQVWKVEVVAPGSLTGVIAQLRTALHDDSSDPQYIETIHTRGYRIIATVVQEGTDPRPPYLDRRMKPAEGEKPEAFTDEAQAIRQTHRSITASEPTAEAEIGLLQTIDRARAKGEERAELRAATRLAGLWKDQGKIGEAQKLLQPIVAGFSEGIDTLPLLEAKALLWDICNHTHKT
ncbi:MAG: transcriptional regulator [Acidobacteria bacterium]|nr:transcriptional regulator [Acidobacteriota bacterium]